MIMNVNINDGANYAMPASYASQPSTVLRIDATVSATSDTVEASSTNDKSQVESKSKKRQPKYRATKRPQSERRFQCDQCESRFFTQKDVKRHLVVHTGIRNFACPFCTQRFGRKDHLVRHAKKSHDQDTRSFRRRTGQSSPASIPMGPKKVTKKASRTIKKEADSAAGSAPLQHYQSSASTSTATTTTSFGLVTSDTRFLSDVRNSATSFETFNHPINIISSTSLMTSLPKVTFVDNSTTSTYTASYANCRNYQPNFEAYSNFNNSSFATSNNHIVGHFLSETGSNYSLTPTQPTCIGYENHYKLQTVDTLAFQPQTQSHMVTSSWPSTSNNASFKSITSSIVDGFNTCIELEYTNIGAANLPTTLSNATFPDATQPRFSNSFP